MAQRILYFLALFLTALLLGPALAHLLELPNKLPLGRDDYFVVQQIYAGWALLAVVVIAALAATLALLVALRRFRRPAAWALAALLCQAGAQALFWIFTWPANQATANWTRQPPDWEALRAQWEWSHAGGAVLILAAVACLILSLLARLREAERMRDDVRA